MHLLNQTSTLSGILMWYWLWKEESINHYNILIRVINRISLDFPNNCYYSRIIAYFYTIKTYFCHYREIQTGRGSDWLDRVQNYKIRNLTTNPVPS